MILTMYVDLKYHLWLFSHKFLGGAFLLGGLHSLTVTSDISQNFNLKLYIGFFIILAIVLYFYKTILGRFLVKRYEYKVLESGEINSGIFRFSLKEKNEKMIFEPGQFVYVTFKQKNFSSETHPFSIASTPEDEKLLLVAKDEGDYTRKLKNIKTGAKALIEGPYGNFAKSTLGTKKQVWIAGGIGITPFLSMLSNAEDLRYKIDLYYEVHEEKNAIYKHELEQIDKAFDNLRIFFHYSKEKGRLSAEKIDEMSNGLLGKEIFICGPPKMSIDLINQFLKLNFPRDQIHCELFKMK
jgi:predicted ferric reductase